MVAVRPDPAHGQIVAIAVQGVAAAAQAEMGARIFDVMSGYAFAYEVEWN